MKQSIIFLLSMILLLPACKTEEKETASEKVNPRESFIIHKGLNTSHWLSQTKRRGEERKAYMTAKDFKVIADMGFDHVRLPIDEMHMWDEEGNKEAEAFTLMHNAIKWAIDNNLRVIVDLHVLRSHHFNTGNQRLWTDPSSQEDFWGFWKQLSKELKQYPNHMLAYELMNEAVADNPEDWNKLIAKGIEVVRENEPDRTIVVGSNKWQQVYTFKDLKVPENDKNIILSFHTYEPFIFSHYKAPWTGILSEYNGNVHYPGYTMDTLEYAILPEALVGKLKEQNGYFDKDVLEKKVLIAKKVADELGLPLYCGEFGCFPSTQEEARVQYYKDIVSVFNKHNIGWTHWNYKNDFPVVDDVTLEPFEMIVSALVETP